MTLCHRDGTHVSDLCQYLLLNTNGQKLLDYYSEKRGWSDFVLDKIDWESMNNFLVTLKPIQRNGVLKLMHNWQNVGTQKWRFNRAQDMTVNSKCAPVQDSQHMEEQCPAG